MPPPSFLLVWDLDHTLGVFDTLAEMRDDTLPVTVSLRQGIDEALTQLSDAAAFEPRQVDARFCVTGAPQDASPLGTKWKDVTGTREIGCLCGRIAQRAHSSSTVGRRYTRRRAVVVID